MPTGIFLCCCSAAQSVCGSCSTKCAQEAVLACCCPRPAQLGLWPCNRRQGSPTSLGQKTHPHSYTHIYCKLERFSHLVHAHVPAQHSLSIETLESNLYLQVHRVMHPCSRALPRYSSGRYGGNHTSLERF